MDDRISRDKLFISVATLFAQRSTCERAQVGAVVVRDNRVISTGYGGAPSGEPHCFEVGCEIGPEGGCIRTVHAEVNAIAFAAKYGVTLEGSVMYVTHQPCFNCAKIIINAGIKEVVYRNLYRDRKGVELLLRNGITIFQARDPEIDD